MASQDVQSYQERQEDELEVLKSMYVGDVDDLRTKEKAAWNVKMWQPIKVGLKLYPQESQGPHSQVFAQVEMIITCSPRYPDVVPDIELRNSKNVPEKKLLELKDQLTAMAKDSIGEVMIMNLAEEVRKFLHAYNKPPAKSFYEQMLDKQRREEEERVQKQREQQEEERCRKEEEMRQVAETRRRRQQELIEERNQTRSKKGVTPPMGEEGIVGSPPISSSTLASCISPIITSHSMAPTSTVLTPGCPPPVGRKRLTSTPRRCSESETEEADGKGRGGAVITLVFNKGQEEQIVQRGKPQMSQGGGGSTVYHGWDQTSGEAVAITEWVFKWRKVAKKSHYKLSELDEDKEGLAYLNKVKGIGQEVSTLTRLSHPNIIRYLGFCCTREPGKITVHVLSEFCGGSNLGLNLHGQQAVAVAILRHHTQGMVQALHYLHQHAVVHKLFRASCVFVDSQGKVRLGDYAIDKRLRDLYREVEMAHSRVMFEDSADRMPPTLGRGFKKGDIYQLGVTVLSLAVGDYISDTMPEIPASLHPALVDFLNKCLVSDDRQRWTTSQLLEHSFLKEPLPPALSPPSPKKQDAGKQGGEDNKDDSDEESDFILYRTSMERSGKSRLTQEFHVEKTLGRGGFGDVLKVKNKLDGQVYAIKRIMINPRSKLLSKKITREVNLLSRLNHENIVRYYNAWMEFTDDPAYSETSSGSTLSSKPTPSPSSPSMNPPQAVSAAVMKKGKDSLDMFDDIEDMAPKAADGSVDWSISRSFKADDEDESLSSDDDDDNNGLWGFGGIGASFLRWSSSGSEDSIGFEDEEGRAGSEDQQTVQHQSQAVLQTAIPHQGSSGTSTTLWSSQNNLEEEHPRLKCLYIQMQYCEKSTLRRAIDQGLYQHMDRVWKYFREITEGLLYIHDQKMIHRDLKPVNIFLDASDLVKIGDFGLATTDIVKQKTGLADSTMTAATFPSDPFSSRSGYGGSGDGDMTGEVGTALYVSPEMMKGGSKLRYDQKVDIYSLGIIFFEMVYRPLDTSMERFLVLSNLRKESIIFPEDFNTQDDLHNQMALLRQMLNHDPSQRPSSKDLLQSPHLPAMQEAEALFNQRLEEAVRNPESQTYRRLLAQFFSQPSSVATDMTYNLDQVKGKAMYNPVKLSLLQGVARERVERVFECHGAVRFTTPLLMPRPKQYDAIQHLLPCFLDKSGAVVSLPFDLRLPFARYVAHNNITNMKRYNVECVYRQLKAQSLHPREFMECAMDIISTTKNCLPEAQLLLIVQQVIEQFPVLQSRGYVVCMNHTKLIEAVLLNAGVPQDKLTAVMQTLVSQQTITEETIRTILMQHSIGLSPTAELQLKTYLETEADLNIVSGKLRPLTRQPGLVGSMAKEGLHELDNIVAIARDLGLTMKVIVSLCLVYNLRLHSGLIFQVYYKKQHKKLKAREVNETLASGGRYDKLVSEFSHSSVELRAVGVSIAFDILLSALVHETGEPMPSACDVVVCSVGHKPMLKERLQITRNLLAAGIRTELQYEPLADIEELQDKCKASGIPFLVVLKDTRDREGDSTMIRVKMLYSKAPGQAEKRVNIPELVDMIQQKLAISRIEREAQESGSSTVSGGGAVSSTWGSGGGGGGGGGGGSSCAGNTNRSNDQDNVSKTAASGLSFSFTYTSKMPGQTRKRIEQSVCNKAPKWLTGETDVVVAELPEQAIRTIQAFIELNKEDTDFNRSVNEINEKLSRHRKYLQSVMDHIRVIHFEKKKQHLLLYGTKEDTLRLLT